jgi:hypothetical protein
VGRLMGRQIQLERQLLAVETTLQFMQKRLMTASQRADLKKLLTVGIPTACKAQQSDSCGVTGCKECNN